MAHATWHSFEHPADVLQQARDWLAEGADAALVVITGVEGGSVRAPGAMMAVRGDGEHVGYISGGCIDADVITQAKTTIATTEIKALRYGAGSPFIDLPLPCGGAIELLIFPNPEFETLEAAATKLQGRESVCMVFSEVDGIQTDPDRAGQTDLVFVYEPKLRLRIAGRGADCLALAQMAHVSGYEVQLQVVDEEDMRAAKRMGLPEPQLLETPDSIPDVRDDDWTAFVLMFHDREWEVPLLRQALKSGAFYIGAVGSRHTHEKRCRALLDSGISLEDVARIRGPIGLVGSLRNSSQLAVSVLAEIIQQFENRLEALAERTAVIMLAAGTSQRFGTDKLVSQLNGQAILKQSLGVVPPLPFARKIGVVKDHTSQRAEILRENQWDVIENSRAEEGQATSLQAALSDLKTDPQVDRVVFLLGDMPLIPSKHIEDLLRMSQGNAEAFMSISEGVCMPPAVFKRGTFEALMSLKGDAGARQIFTSLDKTATLSLASAFAQDIDTPEDLLAAEAINHG